MLRHRCYLKLLLAICSFLLSGPKLMAVTVTVPEGYQLVRDCREDWLVYDEQFGNYVPYLAALHEMEPSVSIVLDLVRERHFTFILKTNREGYLFINGALQKTLAAGDWHYISCDSLYSRYGARELMLTVFGLRGLEGINSAIVSPLNTMASDSLSLLSPSLVSLKLKSSHAFRDFSGIAWLLIVLVSSVVFLLAPAVAYKITGMVSFLSRDFRSDLYHHHRAYDPVIIVMEAVLAFIAAFLLMAVDRYVVPVLPPSLAASERDNVWALLGNFAQLSVVCFVMFYLKYFFISITAGILNLTEIMHVHFIKTLQSSLMFYGSASLGILLLIFQAPGYLNGIGNQLIFGLIVYYCVRCVVLYILLNQSSRFLNLYLISYLCVVELIPPIIGVKFIM